MRFSHSAIFISGLTQYLDDIPVFFYLDSNYDILQVNIIYVLIGTSWLFRICVGIIIDTLKNYTGFDYRVLLCLLSVISSVLFLLFIEYKHYALLVGIEYAAVTYRTISEMSYIENPSDGICFEGLRVQTIGKTLGRLTGSIVSFVYGNKIAFYLNATIHAFSAVSLIFLQKPIKRKSYSRIADEQETQSLQKDTPNRVDDYSCLTLVSNNILMISICVTTMLPRNDYSHHLWYISVIGYQETHFIFPLLVYDILCLLFLSINVELKNENIIMINASCLLSIMYVRLLSNSLLFPALTDSFLLLTFVLLSVTEQITYVNQLIQIRNTEKNDEISVFVFTLQDSVPVLTSSISVVATLSLVYHLGLSQDHFESMLLFSEIVFFIVAGCSLFLALLCILHVVKKK